MDRELKKLATVLLNTNDISSVKKKYQTEYFVLSSKVNRLLNSSVNGLVDSVSNLKNVFDLPAKIKRDIDNLAKQCDNCKVLDQNFALIDRVFTTRKRLADVAEYFQRIHDISGQVDRLGELFQQDLDQEYMKADNLLAVYWYIVKIEDAQLELCSLATDSEVKIFLNSFFTQFNAIKKKFFNEYLFELSGFIFDLVVEGQFDIMVWVAKIVEEEEKRDSITVKVKEALESSKEANKLAVGPIRFKANKEIRNLKRRFFNCMKECVRNRFESVLQDVDDLDTKLENMRFFMGDLILAHEVFCSLFPASWNIFDFFLMEYHRMIYTLMDGFSTTGEEKGKPNTLSPMQVLSLLRWSRDYYEQLQDKLAVEKEHLDPSLLDKREAMFIGDFIKRSKGKIEEWILNLERQFYATFSARENPPDLDLDEKYVSPAATDLFQIIKQNVDSAAKSSRGQLLYEMVNNLVTITEHFQKAIIQMSQEDTKKYINNPESIPPGLDHYLVMIGNTCLKWIEYTDDLSAKLEVHVENEYKERLMSSMQRLHDGFLEIIKITNNCLVDMILYSGSSAIQLLFSGKWHSEEPIIDNIIATFEDFFGDAFVHCEDFLFSKLQTDLMDQMCFKYIDRMRHKNSSFKAPQYTQQLQYDYEQLDAFFAVYKDKARVEKSFDPICKMNSILCAQKQLIGAEIYTLWRTYYDVPLWFLDTVLRKRSDLDSSSVKEAIESISKKIKEESASVPSNVPFSIFSKLKK